MKTKPLKALEPGIKKKEPKDFIMWIIAACIIISIIETIGFKEKIRQQSATIARQQLIIDTLKDTQKEADWYQARFERDQEGD